MKEVLSRGRVERLVMAQRDVPPRRAIDPSRPATSWLTPNAMCPRHGLTQFASPINQPAGLFTRARHNSTEARRGIALIEGAAEA